MSVCVVKLERSGFCSGKQEEFLGSESFEDRKMSSLSRELVFLILQFLEEEKFMESVHR